MFPYEFPISHAIPCTLKLLLPTIPRYPSSSNVLRARELTNGESSWRSSSWRRWPPKLPQYLEWLGTVWVVPPPRMPVANEGLGWDPLLTWEWLVQLSYIIVSNYFDSWSVPRLKSSLCKDGYPDIFLVWPPPCNSDHQDYMFRISASNLNLHFPLLKGGGNIQDTLMIWLCSPRPQILVWCSMMFPSPLGDEQLALIYGQIYSGTIIIIIKAIIIK